MQDDLRTLLHNGILTSLLLSGVSGCDGSSTEGANDDASAQAPFAGLASSEGTAALEDPSGSSTADLLAAALDEQDPFARAQHLASLLPTLGEAAVPAIRAVLADPGRDLDPGAYDLLLRTWTRLDAEAAARWTFESASPMYRLFATRTAIETWAEADPASALVGVESALMGLAAIDRQLVSIAEHAVVRGWFRKDRGEAERYVKGLGSGVKRQRALMAFALALAAAGGSDATIAWAEAVSDTDERYRTEVHQQTLAALSVVDMTAATRFCDAHCDEPHAQGLRGILSHSRIRQGEDGAVVLDWIARSADPADLHPRTETIRALRTTFSLWARLDPERSIAWMQEQLEQAPPPTWVNLLIGEYARQIATRSTKEAIQWAERITDASEREQTLVRIGRYWIRTDEDAAEKWLRQSNLPETTQVQIRDRSATIYLPNLTNDPDQEG